MIELLVLANNYGVNELKQKCVDIIGNGITIENVCTLYCTSIKFKLTELENKCFKFAANKMKAIFKTDAFRKMDENSLKIFLEKASDYDVFK